MNAWVRLVDKVNHKAYHKSICRFCSEDDFQEILNWEQIRSKRDKYPLTNLVVDFSKCQKQSADDFHYFFKKAVPIIDKNTRGSDIKCIINKTELHILLIDTSLVNGQVVQARLHELFTKHLTNKAPEYIYMIKNIEYKLSPIVFAFDSEDEDYIASQFHSKKQKMDSIAINY